MVEVVDLMEVLVNFGGGREVVVMGFDNIGGGGCLMEVEGGGGVDRGCGEVDDRPRGGRQRWLRWWRRR